MMTLEAIAGRKKEKKWSSKKQHCVYALPPYPSLISYLRRHDNWLRQKPTMIGAR